MNKDAKATSNKQMPMCFITIDVTPIALSPVIATRKTSLLCFNPWEFFGLQVRGLIASPVNDQPERSALFFKSSNFSTHHPFAKSISPHILKIFAKSKFFFKGQTVFF